MTETAIWALSASCCRVCPAVNSHHLFLFFSSPVRSAILGVVHRSRGEGCQSGRQIQILFLVRLASSSDSGILPLGNETLLCAGAGALPLNALACFCCLAEMNRSATFILHSLPFPGRHFYFISFVYMLVSVIYICPCLLLEHYHIISHRLIQN